MKNRPLSKTLLSLMLAVPCALSANWTLLSDFEAGDPSAYPNLWLKTYTDATESAMYIFDESDESDNSVFFVDSGHRGQGYYTTIAVFDIGEAISLSAGRATVYFRALQQGTSNKWHVTLTDVDDPTPDVWNEHSVILQYETGGQVRARDGNTAYLALVPDLRPENDQWYHYWIVLDASANRYELYVQQPGQSAPVLMGLNKEPADTFASFRRVPEAGLDRLCIITDSGHSGSPNAGDIWMIDDINIDRTGQNLSIPGEAPVPTWAGYAVDANGWADTGDWLGYVHVDNDPWVYSDKLSGWVYAPDAESSESGIWLYVLK